jgi:urea transport system permease protein
MWSALVDGLFSGVSIGSVLLLSALGLAIVFGLMGVINMAHGELMMLGAYTTVLVQGTLKGTPLFDSYILFALIAAFIVTALFGLLLERTVIRYLYGRPLETLLATWGVSLMLQQFCAQCQLAIHHWHRDCHCSFHGWHDRNQTHSR